WGWSTRAARSSTPGSRWSAAATPRSSTRTPGPPSRPPWSARASTPRRRSPGKRPRPCSARQTAEGLRQRLVLVQLVVEVGGDPEDVTGPLGPDHDRHLEPLSQQLEG